MNPRWGILFVLFCTADVRIGHLVMKKLSFGKLEPMGKIVIN